MAPSLSHHSAAEEKVRVLEGIDPAQVDLRVMIPASTESDLHFIHGPAVKVSDFDPSLQLSRRIRKERLLFKCPAINAFSWNPSISRPFRSWPASNLKYVAWLDRVQAAKAAHWRRIDVFDVIQFSRDPPRPDPYLIGASLCFWSTSTNSLHLRYGMSTPTLLDLAAIAGLRPHGTEVNAGMEVDFSIFNVSFDNSLAFTSFIDRFNGKEGPVSDQEHVAFLLYWICRYLVCTKSLKIVKEFLKLSICLAEGQFIALGPFVLSQLYRSLASVVSDIRSEDRDFRSLLSKLDSRPNYGIILLCVRPVWDKLTDSVFTDFLSFFFHVESRTPERIAPFVDRQYGPDWFRMYSQSLLEDPNAGHLLSELPQIWSSFLVPRDLHVGLTFNSSFIVPGTEVYLPHFVARQFGLIQTIPLPLISSFSDLGARTSFDVPAQVNMVDEVNSYFFDRFHLEEFTPYPSTVTLFDEWWGEHCNQLFGEDFKHLTAGILFTPPIEKTVDAGPSMQVKSKSKKKGFEAFLPRLGGIKSPGQVTFSGYYANWPEDKLPKPCVTGDKPFFDVRPIGDSVASKPKLIFEEAFPEIQEAEEPLRKKRKKEILIEFSRTPTGGCQMNVLSTVSTEVARKDSSHESQIISVGSKGSLVAESTAEATGSSSRTLTMQSSSPSQAQSPISPAPIRALFPDSSTSPKEDLAAEATKLPKKETTPFNANPLTKDSIARLISVGTENEESIKAFLTSFYQEDPSPNVSSVDAPELEISRSTEFTVVLSELRALLQKGIAEINQNPAFRTRLNYALDLLSVVNSDDKALIRTKTLVLDLQAQLGELSSQYQAAQKSIKEAEETATLEKILLAEEQSVKND
uniref:Aminotransferase-like plant mobile domain-containing protein n=1 Tax=Ananas comosus var. bracteatus TaxID=296719 RepID=A0A6V7QGC8_ANACO|nr:unnamed protein product [Ananas comosus var. bracteatus]